MSGQANSRRSVFVLDVSGSMEGMKCQSLQLSVRRFIKDIPENSYVGIVLFNDQAWIEHNVIQINNRNTRDRLIASVPQMAKNSTDIGCGLLMGLQALTQEGISTEGASIFLVTDGQNNCGDNSGDNRGDKNGSYFNKILRRIFPVTIGSVSSSSETYVDRVLPTLLAAKVRVNCVAFGNSADSNLERLARETKGNIYIANDTNREMAVRDIDSAIQEGKIGTEMCEVLNISVCNDFILISQQSITYEVIIDCDIGQNTIFTIGSEDVDKFSVTIQSPKDQVYDMTSHENTKDLELKRCQFKIKHAESGIWTISFIRHTNQILSATLLVTSQPLNSNAIQMCAMTKGPDIETLMPPILIAKICNERHAVIDAEVIATIYKPNGTQSLIKLMNYNNNYMNYFTDYCGPGRYNVSVLAKSVINVSQLININGDNHVQENLSVPLFQRQFVVGCFKVEDFMPSSPPNDKNLQELSIEEAFNSLSLISSSYNLPIDVSVILNSRITKNPITAKKVNQKIDALWITFLATKKLIKSSEISTIEKTVLESAVEKIGAFINSPGLATSEEIQSKLKMLNDIKLKLSTRVEH